MNSPTSSSSLAAVQTGILNCISYNIFIRPPFVQSNGTSDRKSERLAVIQEELVKFNLVCLQEIFSFASGRKAKFVGWLRSKGFNCVEIPGPSLVSGRVIDSGLLIATRFPILHVDWITYSVGSGIDAYVAKGCLYAKILFRDASNAEIPIHVFNTHMQAGYDSGRDTHVANRLVQMAEMRAFIETKTKLDTDPVMAFGDFNINGRMGRTDGHTGAGYTDMLQRVFPANFHIRDLVFEHLGEHPITVNDVVIDSVTGVEKPRDYVLTNRADVGKRQRLDYIFYLTRQQQQQPPQNGTQTDNNSLLQLLSAKSSSRLLQLQPIEMQILGAQAQPFFVQHPHFTQLSDHYAVTATIRLTRSKATQPQS